MCYRAAASARTLRGGEPRVRDRGRGAEVAETLEDAIESLGIGRLDGEPDERRLVVGAPHPELVDLEAATVLDDPREHLAQDIRVDQMAFHRDALAQHGDAA